MYTVEEKLQFSERLHAAIATAAPHITKAAELATQFNLRYSARPITNQAAHKWLTGQTVPALDKLETMADFLNVSVEWLRTGRESEPSLKAHTALERLTLERFSQLPIKKQRHIFAVINDLLAID